MRHPTLIPKLEAGLALFVRLLKSFKVVVRRALGVGQCRTWLRRRPGSVGLAVVRRAFITTLVRGRVHVAGGCVAHHN